MANSISYVKSYTSVLDEVYKRASVSSCLNSPRRMARAGRNAKEIMVPKIEVTGLGDYTRNVGYKTGSITYGFETKTFNYDRGIRLLADVMDEAEVATASRYLFITHALKGALDDFTIAGSTFAPLTADCMGYHGRGKPAGLSTMLNWRVFSIPRSWREVREALRDIRPAGRPPAFAGLQADRLQLARTLREIGYYRPSEY